MKKACFLIVLFLCGLSVENVFAAAAIEGELLRAVKMGGKRARAEVRRLLAEGADVNATDRYGYTPLMWAAYWIRADLVILLLRGGANRTIQNKNGETAEDIARKAGHAKLANIIRDYIPSGRRTKFAGKIVLLTVKRDELIRS